MGQVQSFHLRVSSKTLAMRQHMCERLRADRYRFHKYAVMHVRHVHTLRWVDLGLECLVERFVGTRFRTTFGLVVAVEYRLCRFTFVFSACIEVGMSHVLHPCERFGTCME